MNLASVLATITVNALANIVPFNGQNTGQVSDRFQVYFVPAGYVFAIWGIIYLANQYPSAANRGLSRCAGSSW